MSKKYGYSKPGILSLKASELVDRIGPVQGSSSGTTDQRLGVTGVASPRPGAHQKRVSMD